MEDEKNMKRTRWLIALVAVMAMLLAACGGDEGGGGEELKQA